MGLDTAKIFDLDDMRKLAMRRLPKGVFDFIDRGTGSDIAAQGNIAAFDRVRLLPRVLNDVSQRSTECSFFGERHAMPLAIAPTGAAGLTWFRGELELAKAAAKAKVPFTLATRAMSSIERIAEEAGGTLWLQLYPSKDQEMMRSLLDKAKKAGFSALIVTIDTPTVPSRTYNDRNGFTTSFKPTPKFILDTILHPRWLVGTIGRYVINGGFPRFENLPGKQSILKGTPPSAMLDGTTTWETISDLRRAWPHKLMVKGILRASDAVTAFENGVDAIVVSNHGGRNVDAAPATLDVLPSIADAAGGKGAIFLDGGIRNGGDIAKALALGADGVMIGRPTLYGAAAGGQDGALHVLSILQKELHTTMAMLGCKSIAELDAELIFRG